MRRVRVTVDDWHTAHYEIDADLIDRPLTSIPDSVNVPQLLTPSKLMHGRRLDSTPSGALDPEEQDDSTLFNIELLARRQKNAQRVLQRFQTMSRSEYLTFLCQGVNDRREFVSIEVGDIVQVGT